jgi:hypothetical protein
MHRNRVIPPRIFQLMAAIRDVDESYAQPARRFLKTPRLVAQFRGEEQQSFGRVIWNGRQGLSLQTNDSVCGNDSLA